MEDDWGGSAQDYSDPYDSMPFGDAVRWEEDRVFEDMAIERRDAEAEAMAEAEEARLRGIVADAVEHREYDEDAPIWGDVVAEIVAALVTAGVEVPEA